MTLHELFRCVLVIMMSVYSVCRLCFSCVLDVDGVLSVCVCVLWCQVGVAACQLARAFGLKVLGTAGTPDGMKLVLSNGAHLAFNHREKDYMDKIQVCSSPAVNFLCVGGRLPHVRICVLQDATEGQGVNVIVEMLSNVNLSNDLKLLASGGRVLVRSSSFSTRIFLMFVFSTSFLTAVIPMLFQIVGCRGSVEINPRDMMAKESSIIGVSLYSASKVKWSLRSSSSRR